MASEPSTSPDSAPSSDRWWEDAVFYQIYPRSFADASGNGVGDLAGIESQLPYLQWLGVDSLWLSPIFRSPMADFGYDVSDYCDIDPIFGTIDDYDRLLRSAHSRDIRLTIDWVPNHTSDQHPWFLDARSSPDSAKRDWYVWRDPAPGGGEPNNWEACWEIGPAWTFDEASGQYYLHLFLPEQPDLNWSNPEVEAAMLDTLRFWLDRGTDGFRADVINLIGKDDELADLDRYRSPLRDIDGPRVHQHLRAIRQVLDGYPQHPMMVGEITLHRPGQVRSYYGDDDELQLGFNFRPIYTRWDAAEFRTRIEEVHDEFGDDHWPVWVLGNHDQPRQRTRYGSDARARAAAVMLLTLRGTPYLYAGEELGLPDAHIPEDRIVDPGGRDGCRAPIPWTRADGHGWGPDAWLPFVDDAADRSVEAQRDDPDSTLSLYRSLLALRRSSPTLRRGRERLLDTPEGVVAWRRSGHGDDLVVLVNFTDEAVTLGNVGDRLISSIPGTDRRFDGTLLPDEAVVVRDKT